MPVAEGRQADVTAIEIDERSQPAWRNGRNHERIARRRSQPSGFHGSVGSHRGMGCFFQASMQGGKCYGMHLHARNADRQRSGAMFTRSGVFFTGFQSDV
jgi:hypothetical protein